MRRNMLPHQIWSNVRRALVNSHGIRLVHVRAGISYATTALGVALKKGFMGKGAIYHTRHARCAVYLQQPGTVMRTS